MVSSGLKIAIVGGGLAGLAAAMKIAEAGHEVDLISVVPRHLVASTGVIESLVAKELPFALPVVHVDMLWHERDTRNPSHKWIRGQFAGINYSGVEEAAH